MQIRCVITTMYERENDMAVIIRNKYSKNHKRYILHRFDLRKRYLCELSKFKTFAKFIFHLSLIGNNKLLLAFIQFSSICLMKKLLI